MFLTKLFCKKKTKKKTHTQFFKGPFFWGDFFLIKENRCKKKHPSLYLIQFIVTCFISKTADEYKTIKIQYIINQNGNVSYI